jgi:hypothetical protein
MIDPSTLTNFASLMGMLATFFQERRSNKTTTIEDLRSWLESHHHDELVGMLANNLQLSSAIERLLQNQHGEVMAKLAQLDGVISTVASHLADFKPIAQAMAVKSQLSPQAISILRQMNAANAMRIIEFNTYQTHAFAADSPGPRTEIKIQEPRFIEDDLTRLCDFGLLQITERGTSRAFTITRAGAALGGQ